MFVYEYLDLIGKQSLREVIGMWSWGRNLESQLIFSRQNITLSGWAEEVRQTSIMPYSIVTTFFPVFDVCVINRLYHV